MQAWADRWRGAALQCLWLIALTIISQSMMAAEQVSANAEERGVPRRVFDSKAELRGVMAQIQSRDVGRQYFSYKLNNRCVTFEFPDRALEASESWSPRLGAPAITVVDAIRLSRSELVRLGMNPDDWRVVVVTLVLLDDPVLSARTPSIETITALDAAAKEVQNPAVRDAMAKRLQSLTEARSRGHDGKWIYRIGWMRSVIGEGVGDYISVPVLLSGEAVQGRWQEIDALRK